MAVRVEGDRFEHDLAPRLRERALELGIGEQRVHDRAGVVDPHEALGRDLSGLALDAHHREHRAGAPHFAVRLEEMRRFQPQLDARRWRAPAIGQLRDGGPAREAIA